MKKEMLNRSYGLVFEGGGAKGAYEIGVWKALSKLGIKIDAVVGTSVGALNGALVAQGDLDKALNIWENIRYSSVINVEDELVDKVTNLKWNELNFLESSQQFLDLIKNKGLDITPLKEMLIEMVNEDVLRNSHIDFGLATFNLTDFKPLELMISDIEKGQVPGYLLASAYLPSFKTEKIFGKRFLDGGFHNVVPTSMLVDRGYKNIIEVRIQGIGLEKKYDESDVNIIRIAAREDLGRLLELNPVKVKKNINLGYFDTLRTFKNLVGEYYYINASNKEASYLKVFIMLKVSEVELIMTNLGVKNATKNYKSKERFICEELIPLVAKKLKLSKEAKYKEIYITLLERAAKALDVERFKVYKLKAFKEAIKEALNEQSEEALEELLRNDNLIELVIALGL